MSWSLDQFHVRVAEDEKPLVRGQWVDQVLGTDACESPEVVGHVWEQVRTRVVIGVTVRRHDKVDVSGVDASQVL